MVPPLSRVSRAHSCVRGRPDIVLIVLRKPRLHCTFGSSHRRLQCCQPQSKYVATVVDTLLHLQGRHETKLTIWKWWQSLDDNQPRRKSIQYVVVLAAVLDGTYLQSTVDKGPYWMQILTLAQKPPTGPHLTFMMRKKQLRLRRGMSRWQRLIAETGPDSAGQDFDPRTPTEHHGFPPSQGELLYHAPLCITSSVPQF
ncbi:hypothetical protein BC830DRAFT_957421 [Chytriomyces sp. MP71]|nr:hypothetical protein BC830DRAFT_957421 [Chytriomyces sp. MP71]